LNASMTQNVVTYTVEIITDNKDGRLLPYLTANVQFELQHLNEVLRVPNAALRWTPQSAEIAPQTRESMPSTDQTGSQVASRPRSGTKARQASDDSHLHLLWTTEGAYVRPIKVRTGASDGILTAIEGDGLTEGLPVVTGLKSRGSGPSDDRNPFTPQFMRRNRSQQSR